jgi:hypothetical protein
MLPAVWLIVSVLLAVVLTAWVTFTLTRLDRLHARVDAAQAALDAQLVRRVAALMHVCEAGHTVLADAQRVRYVSVAKWALAASGAERQLAENGMGHAVAEIVTSDVDLAPAAAGELAEAAERVLISRRFYNDAVRDTRSLRGRRMPRLLHLAGHREMPQFFDIDDTVPSRT